MAGSADAIAHVQEGIIVDANPAWLDLYGFTDADALTGTPLMDVFDADAHAALKGALVACLQGKWSNHTLKANALLNDGSSVPLEMELSRTEFDGEPAVRLCFAARKRESGNLNEQLTEALERDASTGALQRTFFIEHLKTSAGPAHQGGRARAGRDSTRQARRASADDIGPLVARRFHRAVRRPDRRDAPGRTICSAASATARCCC